MAPRPTTFSGPVKQKRALLESNPPRDSRIEGDEIKSVSVFGETNTSPKLFSGDPFISSRACLKNSRNYGPLAPTFSCLHVNGNCPFHAEPRQGLASAG